ncbi:MAG: acetolactate synthase large subunit [Acidimicrobiia bacterium]|nr:acetolactate synthase large subunit [Acidimicrobiia bacterium]
MNGAQALIRTLVASGVDTCFTNPGTSEMHFVAALDTVPEMRAILGLFEGVVSGAADGYARMSDTPAATLLHLGSGLGNGLANLHNARRARVPVVNIVGDHATYHLPLDAPLTSDIPAIARGVSSWVWTSESPAEIGGDAAAAVAAAHGPPAQVATLILPADVSWGDGAEPAPPAKVESPTAVSESTVAEIAKILRTSEPAALLLGGRVLRRPGLEAAGRVAHVTGAQMLAETFPTRLERGAGLPAVSRLGYLAEFVEMQLAGVRHLVLVDAKAPVSFFAYPGKASDLVPEHCTVHVLSGAAEDGVAALEALAETVGAGPEGATGSAAPRPEIPPGPLTADSVAAVLGALLPDDAIVSDESNTSSLSLGAMTAGAPPHDWLALTGGAIGQGMPVATGAAVASPGRPVVNLESDGSAMYTLQSLWTQAREGLDVTTIIYNNRSYAILNLELSRVGAESGEKARALFDLSSPPLDFVALAQGMGVPATRAQTTDELTTQLRQAFAEDGPHLVEALVPSIV